MNIAQMTNEQLDAFQNRLNEQRAKNDQEDNKFKEVLDLMEGLKITKEWLIGKLGGVVKREVSKSKKYLVVLDGKEFETSATTISTELAGSSEYQTLIKEEHKYSNFDHFLRAYSTEYSKDKPANAVYEGMEFFLNLKGELNAVSKIHYNKYKVLNAAGTVTDFKAAVLKVAV